MRILATPYGRLSIGSKPELFAESIRLAAEQAGKVTRPRLGWALTGGSTPQEWYRWCVSTGAIPSDLLGRTDFTVSDERWVPRENEQSNFGSAERLLLDPLNFPPAQRIPWPVEMEPAEAAAAYAGKWAAHYGADGAYDICFLGMGDDAHTASIFPGSPLLTQPLSTYFTALDVPGKGWRLTITPAGLARCGLVVVMTLGAGKATALARVMKGPLDPLQAPAQLLKAFSDRVVWLVDEAAAAGL
jgi:6-phosphogluconolactonase